MARAWIAVWALTSASALLSGLPGCGDRKQGPPAVAPANDPAPGAPLAWISVANRVDLRARLATAQRAGRPVVVAVWAPWCVYCQRYDLVMAASPELRRRLGRCELLRIDVETDDRADLRLDVGIPPDTQPFMVFVDAKGRVRHDLDLGAWYEDAESSLAERLRKLEGA